MAAGGGDGAGDLLGLGERLKLMAFGVDSKLRLYKEAVVEYTELKQVICDLTNDKERLEQERHKSEELKAANGQLKQKLVAAKKELNTKDKELNALLVELQKGKKSDDGLAEKIVKEINKEFGGARLGDFAVIKIRKLDEKPFKDVYAKLPAAEAEKKGHRLYCKWEKLVNDPSSWNRFMTVVANRQDEVIDENNEELKELKMEGEEAYNSVIDTLNERKEYNIDGRFDFLLWNSKEKRKGTLEECVDCLIALRKQHTSDEKKASNS
ncbi:hypothetical protein U9M48_037144 [Paspalum notatum var. saurae]|uniref:Factor of DNA methylation 1-5/IDN2 domain-containing protein n=1 Tax=Paspalum notatum var. saurae TaxID=547442 RepID=A0AAQ3UFT5_PASNO